MLGRSKGETKPEREAAPGRHRAFRKVASLGLAALAGSVAFGYVAAKDNREELASYTEKETALIDFQRQKAAQCINRVVKLNSSTIYRDTPHTANGKIPFVIRGNAAGRVDGDQELIITRPLRHTDERGDVWGAFTLGREQDRSNPQRVMGSRDVAGQTVWFNYSTYDDLKNEQGRDHLQAYSIPGENTSKAGTVDCSITIEGQVTAADKPAAFGDHYPEGAVEGIAGDHFYINLEPTD